MPVLYEQYYDGAFLISEAPGYLSRELGFMDNATNADILYEAGLVVNQATAGVENTARGATNVGNGTIGSASTGAASEFGIYTLTATSPTTFNVVAPNGDTIGVATVGTPFVGQVNFTLTAGSTAFAVGDSFTVAVTQQTGSWQSWTGGAINRLGILWNRARVGAGNFKKITVVVRNCEVNAGEIQWDPAVTGAGNAGALQAQALAALLSASVVTR